MLTEDDCYDDCYDPVVSLEIFLFDDACYACGQDANMNYAYGDELAIVPYVKHEFVAFMGAYEIESLFKSVKILMILFTDLKILLYLNIAMRIMNIIPILMLLLRKSPLSKKRLIFCRNLLKEK